MSFDSIAAVCGARAHDVIEWAATLLMDRNRHWAMIIASAISIEMDKKMPCCSASQDD